MNPQIQTQSVHRLCARLESVHRAFCTPRTLYTAHFVHRTLDTCRFSRSMYAQLNYKAAMKPNRKTARLQIRLTQDLAERLEALSALTEIPVSLYIRNALTQGLKKWESELVPESLTAFGVQS